MSVFVEIEGERLAELRTDEDSVANPEVAVDDAIELWLELQNPPRNDRRRCRRGERR